MIKVIVRVGLIFVVAMAATVLYGWVHDITIYKTLLPGRPDMKANAAVGFLLSTTAIFLTLSFRRQSWLVVLSSFISVFVAGYGVLVLIQYGFGFNFGIDEFLFVDPNGLKGHSPPGRFSPVTAVNFILISLGLLFYAVPSKPFYRLAQALFMLCLINSFQSFLGSALDLAHIFGMNLFIPMAIHTALSFTILSSLFLVLDYDKGLMNRFTASTSSAVMSRRMLLAALVISPGLKIIRTYGADAGWFSEGVGIFLQTMGGVVFMALLVVVTAGALYRNEVKERAALKEIEQNRLDLQKAKEDAEAASRAKSQFLANMSHEIRTPLGIILGFSELGLESVHKPDEAANYLKSINRNAHELSKLIGDILDLSKVEANKLEAENIWFHWQQQVIDVCGLFKIKAEEKGIELRSHFNFPLPDVIESDSTRFRQILINMIGNAVKFTNAGVVEVTVSAKLQSDSSRYLIEIDVKDSGIGISADQQGVLFKPFSQADSSMTRKFGGTGLGLVLSKQLALILGGDLSLKSSTLGAGSVFTLSLMVPGKTEMTPLPKATQGVRVEYDFSNLKILLAEDSLDNQVLIERYLRGTRVQLEIANNGSEAVEKSQQKKYDLILMDIQMPVMDGFKALTELRKKGFTRPVIAVTAHAMKEERDRAFQAGFNDYLTKPLNKNILLNVLEKMKSDLTINS